MPRDVIETNPDCKIPVTCHEKLHVANIYILVLGLKVVKGGGGGLFQVLP